MNYFEVLGIPVDLFPDQDQVRKNYYKLSREWHPDVFRNGAGEDDTEVLQRSAMLNRAYKTLKDDDLRIKYFLEMFEVSFDDARSKLPQDFLLEMMDLNEMVMDIEFSDDRNNSLQQARKQIEATISELELSMSSIFNNFDVSNPDNTHLQALKEYYLKRQYLRRIISNLENRHTS